jgi:hypothetical protein
MPIFRYNQIYLFLIPNLIDFTKVENNFLEKKSHFFWIYLILFQKIQNVRVSRAGHRTLSVSEVCEFSGECSFEFHAQRGIVALLFMHPQKVESLKKMKKWVRCDPPKWGRGGGGQMVETKNHRTLGNYYPTPKKSLWKSLYYCLYGSNIICRL